MLKFAVNVEIPTIYPVVNEKSPGLADRQVQDFVYSLTACHPTGGFWCCLRLAEGCSTAEVPAWRKAAGAWPQKRTRWRFLISRSSSLVKERSSSMFGGHSGFVMSTPFAATLRQLTVL